MNALLAEVSARLGASARALDALVTGVGPELARYQPAPGKWSILEVFGHLVEEERTDFRVRIQYMLTHPGEAWPAIDPEHAVREGKFDQRALDGLRTAFLAERQKSLAWLAGLHEANWSVSYRHPKMGDFTAASLLCAWAAHDLLHLRQIERLMFQYLGRAAAPDRTDYAGEW